MMETNCIGTFILRPSERMANCYSLTVKDISVQDGPYPKNIRIKMDERGCYYISPHMKYKTVTDLITDYREFW